MKIYRVKNYDETAQCALRLDGYLLPRRMEWFLRFVHENPLPEYDAFRLKLLEILKIQQPRPPEEISVLEKYIEISNCMAQDRELGMAVMLKTLELLKVVKLPPLDSAFDISAYLYYKGWLFIEAYVIQALEAASGRDAALDYYGAYVDWRIKNYKVEPYERVSQHLFAHDIKDGPLAHGIDCVEAELDDGRAAMKVTRCLPCEVLRELNDPQAAFAIMCRGDFAITQKRNPAFRLTREKALTLGMSYCGHIWHDTRFCNDLSHPGRRFWEELV